MSFPEIVNEVFRLGTPAQQVAFVTFVAVFFAFASAFIFTSAFLFACPARLKRSIAVYMAMMGASTLSYFILMQAYGHSVVAEGVRFHMAIRGAEWLLTTALMMLQFPILLGLGDRAGGFIVRIVGFVTAMIFCAVLAEAFGASDAGYWSFFGLACVFLVALMLSLQSGLRDLPDWVAPTTRRAIRVMEKFVLFGFPVYGVLGALYRLLPDHAAWVHIGFSLADVTTKLAYVVAFLTIVSAYSEEEERAEQEVLAPTA